jgi:hypothetical protein
VLAALEKAAREMRGKLGESRATLARFDTPLERATTTSLEALEAYSLGSKKNREGEVAASLPFFERAIQLDPNFAMAYAWTRISVCKYRGMEPGGRELSKGLRASRSRE